MREEILREIKELVENEFGFSITNNSRKQEYVLARAVFYGVCRQFTRASLNDIAKAVGKNHATAIHGMKIFRSFNIQPKLYKTQIDTYKVLASELDNNPKEEITILERIKEEIQQVEDKYNELLSKHKHMLSYYSKYDKGAYKRSLELTNE